MSIKDWPSAERPREKLLAMGAAALSDSELLAILLGTGCKGRSALDLARELLAHYGGLRNILNAKYSDFRRLPGLGSAKYALLQAVTEMNLRQQREKLHRGRTLNNPRYCKDYLLAELRDCEQEIFACIFLDNRYRVITFEKLFFGTINGASVHPRELVKRCLHHNAAAVILAHNHPSGIPEPSQSDRTLTRTLKSTLEVIDVSVLDHFVIGDGELVSFAERGLL